MTNLYPPPLDQLLSLGTAHDIHDDYDYLALGLGAEHIPGLIAMATDETFSTTDVDTIAAWAPIHAWRTLGRLRAEAAIEPLLSLLHHIDDDGDDWVGDELPLIFGQIGPAAIPALAAYLANQAHGEFARIAAARALEEIGKAFADSRQACADVFSRRLEQPGSNTPSINGFLISYLLTLRALEAAPIMERAFAANAVDLTVVGDWEDVQIELGLRSRRETPRRNYMAEALGLPDRPLLSRRQQRSLARSIRKTTNPWAEEKRKQAKKKRKK